jgi:hypothetical protein
MLPGKNVIACPVNRHVHIGHIGIDAAKPGTGLRRRLRLRFRFFETHAVLKRLNSVRIAVLPCPIPACWRALLPRAPFAW